MTNKSSDQKTSDPAGHRQQFYLGLLAGAVIGAGIAYLCSHKKGGRIKEDLLGKAKQIAKHLPALIDELIEGDYNPIDQLKEEVNEVKTLISSEPESSEGTDETSTDAVNTFSQQIKTTANKAQRFFTKAGKILRK